MEKPEFIRKYVPGFIGGSEIADKATDQEVQFLAEMQDKANQLQNEWWEVKRIIKNIKSGIEKRKEVAP
jgi:hypothetical protein